MIKICLYFIYLTNFWIILLHLEVLAIFPDKTSTLTKSLKNTPPILKPPTMKIRSSIGQWLHIVKRFWFHCPSPTFPYHGGRTKCQPDKMPTGQNANLGWHFVRDFFSMVGILSGPTFWLAFCPGHLNMSWHPPPLPPTSESGGDIFLFGVDCCGEKSP